MLSLRNDAPLRPMDVMDESPEERGPLWASHGDRQPARYLFGRSDLEPVRKLCTEHRSDLPALSLFLVAGRRRLTCLGQCANNIGVGDLSIKLLVVPPKTVSRKRECPYAPMTSKSPLRAAT